MRARTVCTGLLILLLAPAHRAQADAFLFSTGNVDGLLAAASRPEIPGALEIEAADDFILAGQTSIEQATFTGLLTGGATPADIAQIIIEIYRVFPADSDTTRTPLVPTRMNSPSDVALDSRESGSDFSFTATSLGAFTAQNSVLNGINPAPNQTTNGEGPVTGQETMFVVSFSNPFVLDPGHYFFVPMVQTSTGQFFWLSSVRPIVAPGTPFAPDLQAWIRNGNLDPDWLRIGTDIIGGSPAPTFNLAFSIQGTVVPEPATGALVAAGLLGVIRRRRGRRRRQTGVRRGSNLGQTGVKRGSDHH